MAKKRKYESKRVSHDIKNFRDGITRKKEGEKFIYYYIDNGKVIDKEFEEWIKKLRIPPAWKNVWVTRNKNDKILAIGTDARGRKQYRYSNQHSEDASKKKYLKVIDFIKEYSNLERAIRKDSSDSAYKFSKYRVITTMLKIVDEVHMRVGKEKYAKENKSYGISSLKKKHIKHIDSESLVLGFKGKSNQRLRYVIKNKDIIAHIKDLLTLDGEKLFQYMDINGIIRKVSDKDLNEYIQKHMGKKFSIKDFRTYAANYHFVKAIISETKKRLPKTKKIIKKNISNALKTTAKYLKHTKAISKKSYVMNFCVELYQNTPEFFIARKNHPIDDTLIEILQLYKKSLKKTELKDK